MADVFAIKTWQYRVVKKQDESSGETEYAVHEAYLDAGGKVLTVTHDAVTPSGESKEELMRDLVRYIGALSLPAIDWDSV